MYTGLHASLPGTTLYTTYTYTLRVHPPYTTLVVVMPARTAVPRRRSTTLGSNLLMLMEQ